MSQFVSWIEYGEAVLFLTAKDLQSRRGKKISKKMPEPDLFSHRGIRQFYGVDHLPGEKERTNYNFWDGNLPQEIKDAWNAGELDGVMKSLRGEDLERIVMTAPIEYGIWVILQKFGRNYEAMKEVKSHHPIDALDGARTPFRCARDYLIEHMDLDWIIRGIGYAATLDYNGVKRDTSWLVHLVKGAVEQNRLTLAPGCNCFSTFIMDYIGYLVAQDYEGMKKDGHWRVALAGRAITGDIKDNEVEYLRSNDAFPRRALNVTHWFQKQKQNNYYENRMMGYAATLDYEGMKRDSLWEIRLAGHILTRDFEAMKKDTDWRLRVAGYLATCNPDTLDRPRL
ncbi:MAG: hypothetical protein KKD17_04345 [Nanoarchaeota archaeon]|nr:hypothetical protein [Nanoarchaeota archaeon]